MGADMSGYCLGRADGQDFQQKQIEDHYIWTFPGTNTSLLIT